jgi:hypothetical protein
LDHTRGDNTVYDAVTIKATLIDLSEEGKWQELELISDQFLVPEQAVVYRSVI